ncbi:MAG TPA: ABC transporter ATP-binding protein [Micromonosporaceae bacterium]|nr:ABC transporter ATP-binding protein [Micromonosporaceae bacterium]
MADQQRGESDADLLRIDDLTLRFGGLRVLDRISMSVPQGIVCGLVGPNGAGKTSLFNCVSGLYRPDSGTILIGGVDALAVPPHGLPALGLARTFQHAWLDATATVLDNVLVGGHTRIRGGPFSLALRLPFVGRDEARLRRRALELLEYLDLGYAADRLAGSLPFAVAKRVEIARALLAEPRLLMLDEPAGGIAHAEVDALAGMILRLRTELGLTILLVEHHMGLVSAVTDRVVALVEGRKVAEGSAAQVREHPAVVEAYLGIVT